MSLQKQGKGKIDWTDYTWNPIGGCKHGCDYCYMNAIGKRFKTDFTKYVFRENYLKESEKIPSGAKVFVGSSGDMWGDWVPEEHIQEVLDACASRPDVTFQFLTKNPRMYGRFFIPENCWIGTSIDGTNATRENGYHLYLVKSSDNVKYLSIEPLLRYDRDALFNLGATTDYIRYFKWIIIGGDSRYGAVKPPDEWADEIISVARDHGVPVWIKNNYGYHSTIKEIPKL